jgi:hypothetical protein
MPPYQSTLGCIDLASSDVKEEHAPAQEEHATEEDDLGGMEEDLKE